MEIIGVFKTHFDYGYTDLAKNIRQKYRTDIIAKVIDVCCKTEQNGPDLRYRWTLPAWLIMDIYDGCPSHIKDTFVRLVHEDKITCHALPFTVHTELMNGRGLDDLFLPARRYCRTFRKPFPIGAKMTDVPGHTSALIAPLVKAGVRFLHLGKNPYSAPPDVPLLFWWEDTSGNRILTMYTRFYGSKILPPKGWKYPVWMALNQTGDNEGAHSPEVIDEMRKALPPHYSFRTGSIDDFARELLSCDLSDLPVVRGELGDSWIHGAGTYPCVMGKFRRARSAFYRLSDTAKAQGTDIAKEETEFCDGALQFVEHTFGINVCRYIGYDREYEKQAFLQERKTRPEYAFAEKSWQEQRERVYALERIVQSLQDRIPLPPPQPVPDSGKYAVSMEKGASVIVLPSGRKATLRYEYNVMGADKLHLFMKKYLVRFSDWSTVDFGKLRYPEIDDRLFCAKPAQSKRENGMLMFTYESDARSYTEFGNAERYTLSLTPTDAGVVVRLSLKNKHATPFVEAGNMLFSVPDAKGEYIVQKCGREINVKTDVVRGANRTLWAMDEYARIGNVKLQSIDAPLVSFCRNPILRWAGNGKERYAPLFAVNLFNNQWGTNFPQWIEGDFDFEFVLSETEEKENQ